MLDLWRLVLGTYSWIRPLFWDLLCSDIVVNFELERFAGFFDSGIRAMLVRLNRSATIFRLGKRVLVKAIVRAISPNLH